MWTGMTARVDNKYINGLAVFSQTSVKQTLIIWMFKPENLDNLNVVISLYEVNPLYVRNSIIGSSIFLEPYFNILFF